MEERVKIVSQILVFLLIYILFYFLILGIQTTPFEIKESDSLGNHIPIAKSISEGNFLNPSKLLNYIGYYPAIGETILAVFMLLRIPLNLFNWLGLILLFIAGCDLSRKLKMDRQLSLIFASSLVFLNSVLRLVLTQMVDIYVAVFFIWSLSLLQKIEKNAGYFLKLGLSLGFLTGTKYSGPFLSLLLILVYFREIFEKLNLKKLIFFLLAFSLFGLSWYIRNLFIKGSPFYPGSFLFFEGFCQYKIQDWTPLKTILYTKNGLFEFIVALISEYLIWPGLYILPFIFVYLCKVKLNKVEKRLILISFLSFGIYLLTPSWPENLVSDLRYLFPSIMTLILVLFILVSRLKIYWLLLLPVFTATAVLPQFSYRPKLAFIWLALFLSYNFFGKLVLDMIKKFGLFQIKRGY